MLWAPSADRQHRTRRRLLVSRSSVRTPEAGRAREKMLSRSASVRGTIRRPHWAILRLGAHSENRTERRRRGVRIAIGQPSIRRCPPSERLHADRVQASVHPWENTIRCESISNANGATSSSSASLRLSGDSEPCFPTARRDRSGGPMSSTRRFHQSNARLGERLGSMHS